MRASESGQTLLALLLLGALSLTLALASIRLPGGELAYLAQERRQFAQLREALIARAVNDNNRPGSLPCPSVDGVAPLLAGQSCPQLLAGLPWSTLKISAPLDRSFTPWRYLIAPGMQDSDANYPLNSDHPTALSEATPGIPGANDLDTTDPIAALLIAPGPALPGQQRPGKTLADEIELTLSPPGSVRQFVLAAHSNDRLYPIRRSEIMRAVERRVIGSVLRCLHAHAQYSAGELPWAAPLNSAGQHGESGRNRGRVPATQEIASLTQLATASAAILQQAVLPEARVAACHRAKNLLQATQRMQTRALQHSETCLTSAQAHGKNLATTYQALRAEVDAGGLASAAWRQALAQQENALSSATPTSEARAALQAHCAAWQIPLAALQARLTQAESLLPSDCAKADLPLSPLAHALQTLSPAGESSAAARWPTLWGAAACDFLSHENDWWAKNHWTESVFYHFAPPAGGEPTSNPDGQAKGPQVAGLGPVARLVIAGGAALPGQQRPGQTWADYLEGQHGTASETDESLLYWREAAEGNDQIAY
ncbi:hypothetical protein [Azonexus sp.]|uniref:hypothetical protein n=1 Tax=Azonexus sp. TaxID=1872668 RepID=UPI0039E47AC8